MGTHYCGVQGAESCVPGQGIPGLAGDTGARERRRGHIGLEPEEPGPEGLWRFICLAWRTMGGG